MGKPTAAQMRNELRGRKELRKGRAGGGGDEFPLRVAKVTRVDAKRPSVSLYCLTGNEDNYDDVPLSFGAAGARHFMGAIPEVNDLCIIGYSPAESGYSRTPYIVGWLVPGVEAAYDWIVTSPTREDELPLTPALQEVLKGSFGRRRHKMRQMEPGNVVGSSSQGADIILNESVTLANRRGNEIILRDQDQALVTRSLQQFHAGAGVRTYSGMVQRDATLLPSQVFGDGTDWDSDKQVNGEGVSLSSDELDSDLDNLQAFQPNDVYSKDLQMGYSDPSAFLTGGLYIDDQGQMFDNLSSPDAVYGGKPLYRVSLDGSNGVLDADSRVFSEYRVEVSHSSDGTLPVTEQTDGVDIDRLLPSGPTANPDGSGDLNPLNRSPNEAMVSMVMGTAVGNDPVNDRENYGLPLVPQLFDKNGAFAPSLRGAQPGESPTEHAAFLVTVKNPYDPKAPDAFMAITKGGTFRSYFPGTGSPSQEEFYQTGKRSVFGADGEGKSYTVEADATISMRNTGRGRPEDNVGVEIRSEGGAVSLYGGASATGTPGEDAAVKIRSGKGIIVAANDLLQMSGQTVSVQDSDIIQVTANNSLNINSGDAINASSKTWALTTNGKAEFTFGGPKNGLPTNGALRDTRFTGTPLTGFIGGTADKYEVVFGNRDEKFRLGRHDTTVNVGSYNVQTMGVKVPSVGPGAGVSLKTGLPLLDNKLQLTPVGASLTANVGTVTVQATKGAASVRGTLAVNLTSAGTVGIQAPLLVVTVGALTKAGGVMTDGCLNPLTGRRFLLSGSLGVPTFLVV